MKRGMKGYRSACNEGLEVWGVSCNGPNFQSLGEHGSDYEYPFSYDISRVLNFNRPEEMAVTQTKDVVPLLWPRHVGLTWPLVAAKVPGTWPSNACRPDAIDSSAVDESFKVEFTNAGQHVEVSETEGGPRNQIRGVKYCYSSRAVWVNGVQKYLVYRTSGSWPDGKTINGPSSDAGQWPWMGDHHIIDITNQTVVGTYPVQLLAGQHPLGFDFGGEADPTNMEVVFMALQFFWRNILNQSLSLVTTQSQAANQISCGKDYCVVSTYFPGVGSDGWQVARIKYQGQRWSPMRSRMEDGIEIFASPGESVLGDMEFTADLGKEDTSYTGNYIIMLPSCRVHMDSQAPAPDECWVCAKRKSGAPKLVTGRWLSQQWRGSTDPETGFADGTILDSEVENVILDADDPPEAYSDESWSNLAVRCYNRVYDKKAGRCKDLLFFTTSGESGATTISDVVSTFEDSDLNSGLEDAGISWTSVSVGVEGNGWMPDIDNEFETPAYTGDGGAMSAFSTVNAAFESAADMSISFTLVNGGDVTFKYTFDNRERGDRDSTDPFSEVVNIANTDNTMQFYLDGILLDKVDMVNFPLDATGDDAKFIAWYDYTIPSVSAGSHTLRISVSRGAHGAYDRCKGGIDHVAFPELLIGDDPAGYKRWFYNGEKVQKAEWWTWAKRNEENADPVFDRAATVADYITMDDEGGILYGNPHFVIRLIYDEDLEKFVLDEEFGGPRGDGFSEKKGYVRFTASPNENASYEPPCWNPTLTIPLDSVSDPPWGAFQIMPCGGTNFQVRGANASLRDATIYPINRELFNYIDPRTNQEEEEIFIDYTKVRLNTVWSQRAHGWTIGSQGTVLKPHVEVIWRPTRFAPAWPEHVWPVPPYRSDFENSTSETLFAPDSVRPRNPLFIPFDSDKPRWDMTNFIVPRTYSDAFTSDPQAVWMRMNNDPVDDPEVEGYWHPDELPSPEGSGQGPWPSARWFLVPARFTPTGFNPIRYFMGSSVSVCSDPLSEIPTEFVLTNAFRLEFYADLFWGYTDYEAVACNCDCCT